MWLCGVQRWQREGDANSNYEPFVMNDSLITDQAFCATAAG